MVSGTLKGGRGIQRSEWPGAMRPMFAAWGEWPFNWSAPAKAADATTRSVSVPLSETSLQGDDWP